MLLTIFYTFVILLNMKTAVSLPDKIYLEAEKTAQNMGITSIMTQLKQWIKIFKFNSRVIGYKSPVYFICGFIA